MNIDSARQFNFSAIEILRCPITQQPLQLLPQAEIESLDLNSFLTSSKLSIPEELGSVMFLSNADKSFFYPVVDGIFVLLREYALQANNLTQQKSLQLNQISSDVLSFYENCGWKRTDKGRFADLERHVDLRDVVKNYSHTVVKRPTRFLKEGGKYLLDIACGGAPFPLDLTRNFDKRICIDLSMRALMEAKNNLGSENGIFILGDITNIPLKDQSCDNALSLHTLYHVPQDLQEMAINELCRVTKDDKDVVVVYSWGSGCVFIKIMMFPYRCYHFIRFMTSKLIFPAEKGQASKANQKLYFFCHTRKWFKSLSISENIRFYSWMMLHRNFLKLYIHPWLLGKQLLLFFSWMEDKFSHFWGLFGQYPMIIIRKNNPQSHN